MKEYWLQLKPRERQLLSVGGGVLLLTIVYLAMLEPLFNSTGRLEQQVREQEKLLLWMKEAVAEAKQLQRSGVKSANMGGQSLLSLVDRTARQGQLGDAVKRVEPDGNQRVRVWLERASFDDILRWVEGLQNNYAIELETVVVDKEEIQGRVNARLTFQGGA